MKFKFDLKMVALVSLIYCSLDVMWMMYNSYVPIYLQAGNPTFTEAGAGIMGFGLGPTTTGFLLTLDNIAALLISPFIGMLSDSSKSKLGRRMSFVLLSMPFMVIALFIIPLLPEMIPAELNGQTAQLTRWFVPFLISILVLLLSNAVMFGPGRVLLFDITPSEHRTTANGVTNVLDGILMIAVVMGGAALYNVYKPLPLWVSAVFILAAVLLVWAFIKEPAVTDTSASEMESSPKEIIKAIRNLPAAAARSTIFFMLTMLFSYLGLSLGQAFLTSYAISVLKVDVGTASMMIAILAVVVLIAALPAALLANRFGRKRIMMIGSAICMVICFVLFFFTSTTLTMIGIGVFGVGWIFSNISHSPMMVDHSPSEKYLGTYISMVFVTSTISMIIGPIMGGWLVESLGNNYNIIWPLMAISFVIAMALLTQVTQGEAKKETPEVQMETSAAE